MWNVREDNIYNSSNYIIINNYSYRDIPIYTYILFFSFKAVIPKNYDVKN